MKIQIPEGLQVDAEVGGTAELLAEFKVTEDGELELISLDGVVVPLEDEEAAEEEVLDEDEDVDALLVGLAAEEEAPAELPVEEEYFAARRK